MAVKQKEIFPQMSARDVLEALAGRHTEDVFIPECKDGPSAGTSHLRLDAWAMRRSWSAPTTYGYEIKVTRADFRRDDKWHAYLPLCSQFYFVCPWGMLTPEEMPPEAGLLWVSNTGDRVFQKKKAQHRSDVVVPESLYRYILMGRVRVTRDYCDDAKGSGAWWKAWLRNKQADLETGKLVGKKLRELVKAKILEVQVENERLKKENEAVAETIELLKKYGFDVKNGRVWEHTVTDRLQKLRELFPSEVRYNLKRAAETLELLMTQVEREEKKLVDRSTKAVDNA